MNSTLYSWMMPFWCSVGGGSQEMLIDVLFSLPTISTVTCCGGALGAAQYNTYHWSLSSLQHTHTHTQHLPTPHTHTKASRNPNGFLMAFLNDPDIWANYCPLTIINTVGENSYCATSRLFGLPWATNIHEACTVLSNVTPFLHRCTVYNFAHLHR